MCDLSKEIVFGALTMLDGCQEQHPPVRKLCDEVLVWLSV